MDLAIKLAKEHGVGWVAVKGSNHFGIAGYWSLKAAKEGLVGLSGTNASPIIFPTRSTQPSLGTNPLSFIASAENGDNFALDMATSTVALGKVELADRKGLKTVPAVWGADKDGHPTTDPKTILNGGGLLPLGGQEETGGYKGTGLCMMVEIMCSIMGGATFGKNMRKWGNVSDPANAGQCYIAVDPECFAPNFSSRLQQFLDETRNLKPANPEKPVLVAGDPERAHMEMNKKSGGLVYHGSQIEYVLNMAKKLNVQPTNFKEVNTAK
jgi:LDH2 family malate/lactate/ureidoglycolate dehydrogenase